MSFTKRFVLSAAAVSVLGLGCATDKAEQVSRAQEQREQERREYEIEANKLAQKQAQERAEVRNEAIEKRAEVAREQADQRAELNKDYREDMTAANKKVVDTKNNLTAEQATFEADFNARLVKVQNRLDEINAKCVPGKRNLYNVSRTSLIDRKDKLASEGTRLASTTPMTKWSTLKNELDASAKQLEDDVAKLDRDVTR